MHVPIDRRIEPGKRTQQGGLARSGAAEQRHELARRDIEIEIVEDSRLAEGPREIAQPDDGIRIGHGLERDAQ